MQKHVANYFKTFGYDKSDFIPCEVCGVPAVDIHHIEPRSKFGSKQKEQRDAPANLVALCRQCHAFAHDFIESARFKVKLKSIVQNRNCLSMNTKRN